MENRNQFQVKHAIVKTSKEQKELHMKQIYAALIKMADRENSKISNTPQ
jgi:hypothetical protein